MPESIANLDLYSITFAKKSKDPQFHFIEEDGGLVRFLPNIDLAGSGAYVGRHGCSGMGDFYSDTHGNTGMGFF